MINYSTMKLYLQKVEKQRKLLFTLFIFLEMTVMHEAQAQWVPAAVSKPRYALGATSAGSKAFFAGGDNDKVVFNTVDIYDDNTKTWSTDTCPKAGSI